MALPVARFNPFVSTWISTVRRCGRHRIVRTVPSMYGREMKKVIDRVLDLNGGKVGGKSIVALVVVGLIVLGGFLAYRLLVFELIANLRR